MITFYIAMLTILIYNALCGYIIKTQPERFSTKERKFGAFICILLDNCLLILFYCLIKGI
jgi:hypothetical protein